MAVHRPDIIEAAVQIALSQGVQKVTIESVARAVGLSKPGLLHHFPSKNALLAGMLSYIGQALESSVAAVASEDPVPRGRWVRSLLKVAMSQGGPGAPTDPVRAFKVLLTVSVNNPKLMKPVQQQVRAMIRRILDESDGEQELVAWLAVDGLLLWQHLGILESNDPIALKIFKSLLGGLDPYSLTNHPTKSASSKPKKKKTRRKPT